MSDPFSIASGLAGLLSLSAAILSQGYCYVSSVSSAPEELYFLLDGTAALNTVLRQLSTLAANVQQSTLGGNTTADTLSTFSKDGSLDRCDKLLKSIQGSIAKCEQIKGHPTSNLGKRLIWPFKEKEFKETLQKLGWYRETFTAALSVDTGSTLQRVEKRVGEMVEGQRDEKRRRVATDAFLVDSQQRIEQEIILNKRRQAIFRWLSIVDPKPNHDAAHKLMQQGTGNWLTDGETFGRWLNGDDTFLWLHRIAGAGKTILASTVINKVKVHCANASLRFGLSFFYCDFNDPKSLDPVNLFCSLISQLAAELQIIPSGIQDLYDRFLDKNTYTARKPSLEELVPLLPALVGEFDRIYIVIDGLDECLERQSLLEALVGLDSNSRTHLLVTSREEVDIKRKFNEKPAVCIQDDDVARDVEIYVKSEIEKQPKLKRLPDELKTKVIRELVKGAHSMFRWVKCQIDILSQTRTIHALDSILRDLPVGLDETYERALSKINAGDQELARRIFVWLVCCERAMTAAEIVDAIAIRPGLDTLDQYTRPIDTDDLWEICGGLITINSASSIVRLAHYSVREYLVSLRIENSKVSRFFVNLRDGHTELATMCLTYLSLKDFENGPCHRKSVVDLKNTHYCRNYPMLLYAAKNWSKHFKKGRPQTSGKWYNELFCLPVSGKMMVLNEAFQHIPSGGLFGYRPALAFLACNCMDTEPLQHLAKVGATELARAVLVDGANVNAPGGFYGCALQAAVSGGHEEVIKLLLEFGADINQIGCFGTLEPTTHANNQKAGQSLLKNGVNANSRLPTHRAAPTLTVEDRNLKITKFLITEFQPTAVHTFPSPLHCAAHRGNKEIVKLLLNAGAGVNANGGEYGSVLAAAISPSPNSHEHWQEIWEILLENGANIFAPVGQYGNLLQACVLFSTHHFPLVGAVEFLLERGAHPMINDAGGKYGNALTRAIRKGDSDMVQLLLSSGADVTCVRYGCMVQTVHECSEFESYDTDFSPVSRQRTKQLLLDYKANQSSTIVRPEYPGYDNGPLFNPGSTTGCGFG